MLLDNDDGRRLLHPPPHPFSNRTVFEDDAWTIYNGNAVAVLGLSGLIDTDAAWLEQPAEVD